MFHTSTSFNTDIGAWNVASVVTFMYATPNTLDVPLLAQFSKGTPP